MVKIEDATPFCVVERLGRCVRGSRLFALAWGMNLQLLKAARGCVDRRIERIEAREKAAQPDTTPDPSKETS